MKYDMPIANYYKLFLTKKMPAEQLTNQAS